MYYLLFSNIVLIISKCYIGHNRCLQFYLIQRVKCPNQLEGVFLFCLELGYQRVFDKTRGSRNVMFRIGVLKSV